MRKYFIVGIAGFMLAFAVSAHAEVVNMIGKTVEGVVDLTINGKKMEYQAILIDGTTYAPVRMLAEELGQIVRYDNVTGVKLVKKIIGTRETVNKSIESLKLAIDTNERMLSANEKELIRLRQEPQIPEIITRIKNTENELDRLKKSNTTLSNQLAQLNQTLIEIAAQEAELNPPAPTEPAPQ